jgi:flagellar protein FliS
MSFMAQATSAYRQAATTVSPTVALVRLYDETILLIKRAIAALEIKRFDDAFTHISRATTILRGLRGGLDFDRGGAVAETLSSMYSKNILALHTAFGKKDQIGRYLKIIDGLTHMRDAWVFVASTPLRPAP